MHVGHCTKYIMFACGLVNIRYCQWGSLKQGGITTVEDLLHELESGLLSTTNTFEEEDGPRGKIDSLPSPTLFFSQALLLLLT